MMIGIVILACLFLVTYSVFLYPVLLAAITSVFHNKTDAKSITPKVSLIIAAYNEEKDIEEKIKNSLGLDYPGLEIIVASDGSSDNTSAICEKYQNEIRFFDNKERLGKIKTLNSAVPKAHGEILVFSDANTFYKKDAIRHLVKHFNDDRVGCTTGYVKLIADGREHEQGERLFTRLERFIQTRETMVHSVVGLDGAMFALRKELYESLPNLFIEDFVIGMNVIKKGYRVIYEPQAKAFEASSENLIDEFHRKSRIVAGGFQSLGFMLFLFKKPFLLFAFVSHKVIRWMTVELLLTSLILNLLLLDNKYFIILFYSQVLFYLVACLGFFLKPLSFLYYFLVMQGASLWGLVKYIFNIQKVTWNKATRV